MEILLMIKEKAMLAASLAAIVVFFFLSPAALADTISPTLNADADDGMECCGDPWNTSGFGGSHFIDVDTHPGWSFVFPGTLPANAIISGAYIQVRQKNGDVAVTYKLLIEDVDPGLQTQWSDSHLPTDASPVINNSSQNTTFTSSAFYWGESDLNPINLASDVQQLLTTYGTIETGDRINVYALHESGGFAELEDYSDAGASHATFTITYTVPTLVALSKPPNNLGLVGYWSFNEGTGTVATDFSGNGKSGTLSTFSSNIPQWTGGKRGEALSFPDSDDYVNLGDDFDLNTGFTVCAWAYPTDIANQGYIGGKFDAGTSNGWFIRQFGADWRMGGDSNTLLSATLVQINTWQHLCFVGNTNPGTSIEYVNGVNAAETTLLPTLNDNAQNATIGDRYDNGRNFSGDIDEVRIYNRALGPAEVAALYGRGTGSSGAVQIGTPAAELHRGTSLANGLVGHWTFDGPDTQATIADRSGNGNHGGFVGGATSSAKVSGILGQALYFDSSQTQYVLRQNSSDALDLETALTISAWVKARSESGDKGIFGRGTSAGGDRWYFYLENGGLVLGAQNGTGNFSLALENSPTSHSGEWVHVIGIMDSTLSGSDRIKLYRNGIELTDKTFQWANGFDSTGDFTDIGATPVGDSTVFDGAIDDVRIYNRALTPAEIKQLYNLGQATIRP